MPLVVVADLAALSAGCLVNLECSVGSSSTGEGRGGGMLVPSVKEPNLKSRAGSWNLVDRLGVPLPLARDGMLTRCVVLDQAVGGGWLR